MVNFDLVAEECLLVYVINGVLVPVHARQILVVVAAVEDSVERRVVNFSEVHDVVEGDAVDGHVDRRLLRLLILVREYKQFDLLQ